MNEYRGIAWIMGAILAALVIIALTGWGQPQAAQAQSPGQCAAEDSVFWNPAVCGNHRGCQFTAPWPAPRNVPLCRSIRYR